MWWWARGAVQAQKWWYWMRRSVQTSYTGDDIDDDIVFMCMYIVLM
jgi:hypothetical protein